VSLWALESIQGREQWTVPDEQVYAIGSMLGFPTFKARPITPNQARLKGVDPSVVAAMSKREFTGFKLVPATNSKARKVFG
jgi:hypothetical protein